MIYLAKETLLWAYKTLSTLSNDPNLQGATQKISAIRYVLALDMFYKQYKRECNTRDSNDKAEFVRNINRIVAINDDFYTPNFYIPLASHQGDCAVGSNFYSVGAVKNSLINPSMVINYPQRGNTPLFEIQNGKLFWRSEMISNLKSYISSEEHKLALALWIVRNYQLDSSYILTEIDKIYHSIFTDELCNILIPKYGTDENLRMIDFTNQLTLIDQNDIERLFNIVHKTYKNSPSLPLQQIFYGAPGTGKSHKVNKEIQNTANALVFRTTFHPDSDYSTFVGAYKPTMKSADRLYSADELIDKLSEIKTLGHTYPCHKFAAKYWYSLKGLSAADIKRIVVACDFPESMTVEVGKGIAIGEEMAKHVQNDKIVYSFVPQAFLKAYVAAWQNPEQPVFLVIEEINRGNCAQIFGDIFQLLDRKDGVSEYPIKADQDIRNYLAKEFAGYDLDANILSGEELVLPANLHIWATMNTSDQSLFPIDSAFKRRWDWKYMPIHDAGENWTIALSDVEYDWWDFVEKINNVIGNMTSSEDKKLGYFFCKACNGKIDAEKFVNKVVFYLWNDVFKDYELSDKAFQDGEGKLTFNKFYTPLGDANEATIKTLMENLGVSTSDLISEIDEEAVNLSKDDLSALQQKRLDFWTRYLKYAQNNADYMQYFGGRQTPTKNYYCQFHVLQKKGYLCVVIKHEANKLFVKYETMDEQLYNTLYSHKAAIQSELGDINLTWEGKVGTRERIDIYAEHNVDFNNEQSIFDLIIDRLLRMREVFDKYLNN